MNRVQRMFVFALLCGMYDDMFIHFFSIVFFLITLVLHFTTKETLLD